MGDTAAEDETCSLVEDDPEECGPPRSNEEAGEAIRSWAKAAEDVVDGTEHWVNVNFTDFFADAGGSPTLSADHGMLFSWASNAAGSLITEVGEAGIKKGAGLAAGAIGAWIGTGVAPGPGTVIGFCMGVTIELLVSELIDWILPGATEGEIGRAGRQEMGARVENTLVTTNAQAAAARQQVDVVADELTALSAADPYSRALIIEQMLGAARIAVVPDAGDRSFRDRLLREWALEHAVTADAHDEEIDDADWNPATAEFFEEGRITDEPALFGYQLRREAAEAGLDVNPAQRVIDAAGAFAASCAGEDDASTAEGVAERFAGHHVHFDAATNPQRFLEFVATEDWIIDALCHPDTRDAAEKAVTKGTFSMVADLDTELDGSAVIADGFDWELDFWSADPTDQFCFGGRNHHFRTEPS